MDRHNLDGLKKYLEIRGYNVEKASDKEIILMYLDDLESYRIAGGKNGK